MDVERVQRINQTLSLIPEEKRTHSALRPIELLVIAPRSGWMLWPPAMWATCPRRVRTMLGALGVTSNMADVRGAALASYLLFEAGYTQELMALGRADTLAMRAQVCQFFGWTDTGAEVRTQLHRSPVRARPGLRGNRTGRGLKSRVPPEKSAPHVVTCTQTLRHHRPAVRQRQLPHRPHHGIHPGRHLGAVRSECRATR